MAKLRVDPPVNSLPLRIFPLTLALGALAAAAIIPPACHAWQQPESGARPQIARGIVFHDRNENGRLDESDPRLPEIRISNGREIVRTNELGEYAIAIDDDAMVFVIKPRGYRTRLDENRLPRFFYTHKPAGSPQMKFPGIAPTGPLPQSIDFPLYRQREPQEFEAILFGDTQSRNATEVGYMNRTTIAELVGHKAAFGVTLGDIVFDDLSQFDYHNRSVALIGIPWYNVLGNHDLNFDTTERHLSNETFESIYGPTWYSFDYGQVHFLVLDNINWHLPANKDEPGYSGRFGEEQLQFICNDLQQIPANQFVVLFMHIPLPDCEDAQSLYRLIEQRPLSFSVSAHRHFHQHRFLDARDGWQGEKPHHHLINVTVCGNWWSGRKTPDGIPHSLMTDGAPYGYSILSFDGDRYQIDYKASGHPADFQMRIHLPDQICVDQLSATPVVVNVFNGSAKSQVSLRIDGGESWQELQPGVANDPHYQSIYDEEQTASPPIEPGLSQPRETPHLWRGTLPELSPGVHLVEAQTVDMHGRTFQARRLLHVLPKTGADSPPRTTSPRRPGK